MVTFAATNATQIEVLFPTARANHTATLQEEPYYDEMFHPASAHLILQHLVFLLQAAVWDHSNLNNNIVILICVSSPESNHGAEHRITHSLPSSLGGGGGPAHGKICDFSPVLTIRFSASLARHSSMFLYFFEDIKPSTLYFLFNNGCCFYIKHWA